MKERNINDYIAMLNCYNCDYGSIENSEVGCEIWGSEQIQNYADSISENVGQFNGIEVLNCPRFEANGV